MLTMRSATCSAGRAVLAAIISCEAKAVGLSPSAVADGYAALRSPDLSDEDLEIEQLTNQLVSEAGIDLLPAACPDVEVGEYEPPPSDDAGTDAGTDSNTRDLALEIEDGELDVVGATVRFSINFDSDVQVWLDRNGVIFSSSDVEDIALAELSRRVPADEAGGAVPGTIALAVIWCETFRSGITEAEYDTGVTNFVSGGNFEASDIIPAAKATGDAFCPF